MSGGLRGIPRGEVELTFSGFTQIQASGAQKKLSDWEILTRFLELLKVNDPKAQFRSNVMAEQSRASLSLARTS